MPNGSFSGFETILANHSTFAIAHLQRVESIDEERGRQIIDIERTHDALQQMRKELWDSNQLRRMQAQQTQNDHTNILSVNTEIGDHVMIRTHAKRNHKLQSLRRGPMKVIDPKSSRVFTVEDITTHRHLVVHAQRMVPFPATRFGEHALRELKEQAVHYDSNYNLTDAIKEVRKHTEEYEMLVSVGWFWEGKGWDLRTAGWDIGRHARDSGGLFTLGRRMNWKWEILNLYL